MEQHAHSESYNAGADMSGPKPGGIEGGFARVPNRVVDYFLSELSGLQVKAYIELCRWADRNGECTRKSSTMAKHLRTTHSRMSAALRRLEALGLIERLNPPGSRAVSRYRVVFDLPKRNASHSNARDTKTRENTHAPDDPKSTKRTNTECTQENEYNTYPSQGVQNVSVQNVPNIIRQQDQTSQTDDSNVEPVISITDPQGPLIDRGKTATARASLRERVLRSSTTSQNKRHAQVSSIIGTLGAAGHDLLPTKEQLHRLYRNEPLDDVLSEEQREVLRDAADEDDDDVPFLGGGWMRSLYDDVEVTS